MQLADIKKDLNMRESEICKLFVGSIFVDAMLNNFHFVCNYVSNVILYHIVMKSLDSIFKRCKIIEYDFVEKIRAKPMLIAW